MDKKLEDMTPEEIAIQAQKNSEEWSEIIVRIEAASKSIGITNEQGLKFIDILMFGTEQ